MPYLSEPFPLDFGDGKGPVPARVWENPNGSRGGEVAVTAAIDPTAHISSDSFVASGVKVGADARITDRSLVKHGCHLGPGVQLRNVRLAHKVRVLNDTLIETANIAQYCLIANDTEILRSELAKGVTIGAMTSLDSCRVGACSVIGDNCALSGVEVDENVSVPHHTSVASKPTRITRTGIVVQQPDTSWGGEPRLAAPSPTATTPARTPSI